MRPAPCIRTLVLTTFDTDSEIADTLAAGARGYLLKDAQRATIYEAVRTIMQGTFFLARPVAQRVAELKTSATRGGGR